MGYTGELQPSTIPDGSFPIFHNEFAFGPIAVLCWVMPLLLFSLVHSTYLVVR